MKHEDISWDDLCRLSDELRKSVPTEEQETNRLYQIWRRWRPTVFKGRGNGRRFKIEVYSDGRIRCSPKAWAHIYQDEDLSVHPIEGHGDKVTIVYYD